MSININFPKFFTPISLLLIILALTSFTITTLFISGSKPLWLDEEYSLNSTIRRLTYLNIVINGAKGQGSPSPLDYLISKFTDSIKYNVGYLSLSPFQFIKIHNIVIAWVIIIVLILLNLKNNDAWDIVLFTSSTLFLLLHVTTQFFATEMRPYNLWIFVSFLVLYLLPQRHRYPRLWFISLLALSFTTTASIFQIISIYISIFYAGLVFRKTEFKQVLKDDLPTFVLMIAINFYYVTKISSGGYPTPSWDQFWDFWKEYISFISLSFILTIYYCIKGSKQNFILSLSILFWIALGPVTFIATQYKTFFFTSRQYVHYIPALAVLLSLSLRIFLKKNNPAITLLVLSIFLIAYIPYSRNYIHPPFKETLLIIHQKPPLAIPVNYDLIAELLPTKIPLEFEFIPTGDLDKVQKRVITTNFNIWWDYLIFKYPPNKFPRNFNSKLVFTDKGNNFALLAVESL